MSLDMWSPKVYSEIGLLTCMVLKAKGRHMQGDDDFDREFDALEVMTEAQLTLYLARMGISPADVEDGKARMLAMLEDEMREAEAERYELTLEQELGLKR